MFFKMGVIRASNEDCAEKSPKIKDGQMPVISSDPSIKNSGLPLGAVPSVLASPSSHSDESAAADQPSKSELKRRQNRSIKPVSP